MARITMTQEINESTKMDMMTDLKAVLSSYGYNVTQAERNPLQDFCEKEKDATIPTFMNTLINLGYEPVRTGRGDILYKVGLQRVNNWVLRASSYDSQRVREIITELGGSVEHIESHDIGYYCITGEIPVIMHLNLSCRIVLDDMERENAHYNAMLEYAEARKQQKFEKAISALLSL